VDFLWGYIIAWAFHIRNLLERNLAFVEFFICGKLIYHCVDIPYMWNFSCALYRMAPLLSAEFLRGIFYSGILSADF
jgi:hypothetical protein